MCTDHERHLFVMAENRASADPYVQALDTATDDIPDWYCVAYCDELRYIVEHEPRYLAFAFHESFKEHDDYGVLSVVVSDLIEKGAIVVPLSELENSAGDVYPYEFGYGYKAITDFFDKEEAAKGKYLHSSDVVEWFNSYGGKPAESLTIPENSLTLDTKPEYEIYYIGGPADGEVFAGERTNLFPGTYVVWDYAGIYIMYQCVEVEILGERLMFLLSPDALAESQNKIREFVLGDMEVM